MYDTSNRTSGPGNGSENVAQSLSERFLGNDRRQDCRCWECSAIDQQSSDVESQLSLCLQMMGDLGERHQSDIKLFESRLYETQQRKMKVEAPVSRSGTG